MLYPGVAIRAFVIYPDKAQNISKPVLDHLDFKSNSIPDFMK